MSSRLGPLSLELGDGLIMRTASSKQDVDRVAAFNSLIHGPELNPTIRSLMAHYPGIEPRDMVFVEKGETGEIISSLLLIPWTLSYEGVDLTVGEMGMVGTREDYRGRGLVRALDGFFKQRLRERGCLLSLIQGIPNFYRQFGYEYAMPLEGGLRLSGRELPSVLCAPLTFRQAGVDDMPVLMQLYDEAARDLDIAAARDRATWEHLLVHGNTGALACETWLVQDATGQAVGYFRLPEHHFGDELAVNEVSRLSFDAALATLHQLRALAEQRAKPGIRLNLPANGTLARLARSLDAHDLGTYAWQVHVPNLAALLQAIGPVLEGRLAVSPFTGLSRELVLCFYRDSLVLRFEAGRLMEVLKAGPCEHGARFPPHTFIPVLLGYRTPEQLRAVYPDVSVPPDLRLLVETLFPPLISFIYPSY